MIYELILHLLLNQTREGEAGQGCVEDERGGVFDQIDSTTQALDYMRTSLHDLLFGRSWGGLKMGAERAGWIIDKGLDFARYGSMHGGARRPRRVRPEA